MQSTGICDRMLPVTMLALVISPVAMSDFVVLCVSGTHQVQLLLLHCCWPCTANSSVQGAVLSLEVKLVSAESSRTVLAAGYKFTEQGISSCAVNTSQPVGTMFAVNFVVFDLSIPSKSATVTRTVQIVSPCSPGRVLCPDGTCSIVACSVR